MGGLGFVFFLGLVFRVSRVLGFGFRGMLENSKCRNTQDLGSSAYTTWLQSFAFASSCCSHIPLQMFGEVGVVPMLPSKRWTVALKG